MRTYIFLPPVKQAAGGITVLRQIAATLHAVGPGSGHEAALVLREPAQWTPSGLKGAAPELAWKDLALRPGDLWLVPEGWVNALAPGLEAGARCVSYVQNWAYLFSSLPENITWSRLPVEFLAVSEPVAHFVRETTGRDAPVLRPGIDRELFATPGSKPDGPVRIAYMPRKNKAQARQIQDIFHSRNPEAEVRWTPIEGMDAFGVARILARSHVFLMTGFPEGCPLPPLEAMASGCLSVGFSGYGGWDYMRPAQQNPRFTPWWPVRDVPWGGNGLWCADLDVLDAALLLEEAVAWVQGRTPAYAAALHNARLTADAYSLEAQQRDILDIWDGLRQG
ncbi:glycosyltransferase family protein [Paucidesulfovibrio longus]|uniref:group 1 glycosyl transferase n=1 Tax=Paucidesulfovibrio longus TaxID=889 RepID=UPI0003B3F06B|nr:group 1 glycosyl transferase [Paucidesulfovibrio longus]